MAKAKYLILFFDPGINAGAKMIDEILVFTQSFKGGVRRNVKDSFGDLPTRSCFGEGRGFRCLP